MPVKRAFHFGIITCLFILIGLGCGSAVQPEGSWDSPSIVGGGSGSSVDIPAGSEAGSIPQTATSITDITQNSNPESTSATSAGGGRASPLPQPPASRTSTSMVDTSSPTSGVVAATETSISIPAVTSTPTPTNAPPTNTKKPSPPPPPATPTPTGCAVSYNGGFEDEVVALINQERVNNGLSPLAIDGSMAGSARTHSTWMGCNNQFSHSSNFWGENIAGGQGSPSAVVADWMNSSGHRANILNAGWTKIGIGYAFVAGSTYGHYWTAGFNP